MSEPELRQLERLALEVPAGGTIVEVGTFMGRSAYCLAATAPWAIVYCIDPWNLWDSAILAENDRPEDFRRELRRFVRPDGMVDAFEGFSEYCGGLPNVVPMKETSPLGRGFGRPVDLAFVDGEHSFGSVWRDLRYWGSQLTALGVLAGHDYFKRFRGVIDAAGAYAAGTGRRLVPPPESGSTIFEIR
jgi:hypothetical protein